MESADDTSMKHARIDARSIEAGPIKEIPPSGPSPPSFPDGGFDAWLQCASSFFMFFNCWGVVNSFGGRCSAGIGSECAKQRTLGVFQTFYRQEYITNESSSNISWIGSIQAFFLIFGGVVSGPLYDMGYLRHITIAVASSSYSG